MNYTVHRILQARILVWVAFSFSRGPSQPRDRTQVSHIAGRFFTSWATREAPSFREDVEKWGFPCGVGGLIEPLWKLMPQYLTHWRSHSCPCCGRRPWKAPGQTQTPAKPWRRHHTRQREPGGLSVVHPQERDEKGAVCLGSRTVNEWPGINCVSMEQKRCWSKKARFRIVQIFMILSNQL